MITINGKTYQGNSVTVINGRVIIDGKEVKDGSVPKNVLLIQVEGELGELTTDASVNCGEVRGNIEAGGSVNCDTVGGDISAGGSVNCDTVHGNINAGGSVIHG